jgi:arabinofuranosyltransferase
MRANRHSFANPDWPRAGETPAPPLELAEACGLLGAAGVGRGPHVHLLDDCALADPLLARLPAMFNSHWRPGHFRRLTPPGYRESLESASNLITDPALKRLYDDVRLVTRGPVWSRDRLRAIWRLNTGGHRRDVDFRFYRHGGRLIDIEALSAPMAPETTWNAPGTHVLDLPLAITCEDRPGRRFMDVAVDSNDGYVFVFLKRNRVVAQLEFGPVPQYRRRGGLAIYTVDVPLEAVRRGFDTIVVAGTHGDELYSIGHLLLDGNPSTQAELDRRVQERDAPKAR